MEDEGVVSLLLAIDVGNTNIMLGYMTETIYNVLAYFHGSCPCER